MRQQGELFLKSHATDYYLINLPEVFDLTSLDLLKILLDVTSADRPETFSRILVNKFFNHDNPLVSRDEFYSAYPHLFNTAGLFRLIKLSATEKPLHKCDNNTSNQSLL
jgi:hypothetical protein